MKLLLDTHIFLWYVSDDPKLPNDVRNEIRNSRDEVYLSVASVWEAVVKYAIGKLPLPSSPAQYLPQLRQAHRIRTLPIDEAALVHLAGLPSLHADPFDRILIAQAIEHDLTLVSVHGPVRQYPVRLLPT